MCRKLISHHWCFICRSLFEWKQFLGLYVYLFPTLLWSDSCLLGYLYIVSTISRKHLYFLLAFSYLTVMMIVLTASTICGLLSCLTVSEDIMKPSNLWAGRRRLEGRISWHLGNMEGEVIVGPFVLIPLELWHCDPCRTVIGISGHFCHYDPDNTGTVACCCWPQMMSNDFNIFLAASFSDSASAAKV